MGPVIGPGGATMIRRAARSLFPLLLRVDDLLRGRAQFAAEPLPRTLASVLLITIVCGSIYGAAMGTFGGLHQGRWVLPIYAAIKVPMLLLVSFWIAIPSFFVLNTVAGIRRDFAHALHALVSTQAVLTVVLASLAPFTAFWYASSADYPAALLFNGAMFAIATFTAQWVLRRGYRTLIQRDAKHRLMLRVWLVLYTFVAIQMAWVLRPFVGDPHTPPSFFRAEAWGNAYIEIARLLFRAVSRA